jgi:hypothetical protein
MTMEAGAVTVNDDETYGGAGAALALFESDLLTLELNIVPTLGDTTGFFNVQRPCNADDVAQAKAARLATLRDAARRANAYGVIVQYIAGNAELNVVIAADGSSTGLLRLPTTFTAGGDCFFPATEKHLPGTIG